MSIRRRLVGVALALLLPGALLGVWASGDGPSMQILPSAVPARIGPWSGVADERLDDVIVAELAPSSYVARIYEADHKPRIALYAGFYAGRVGRSKAPHDPEVCFPSAGWETLAARWIEIPTSVGDSFRARLLDTHQRSDRQLVLYWFQPAGRWPRGIFAEELLFLLDALAGRPQYGFVRLVAGVPDASSRPAVLADLVAFAGGLAGPLRDVVTDGGGPSPTTDGVASLERPGAPPE